MRWGSLLLGALAACSFERGEHDGTSFRCDDERSCPEGMVCFEGACVAPDEVPPDAAPEPDGLLHHWTLDEGDGDEVGDAVGGANGAAVGGATWIDGRRGGALACDGDDDWVEIPPSVPIELGTEYTIALWARPATETGEQGALVFVQHATTMTLELLENRVQGIAYEAYSAAWPSYVVYGEELLPGGVWTHVAFRVRGTELRIYVGGVLDALATSAAPVTGGGAVASRLCARHPDNQTFPFAGAIDDVRVYGRALGADEIAFLAGPS